jgi:GDP-L-fucose synthase
MESTTARFDVLRDKRIYVAGHTGLVGSALLRALQAAGCRHVLLADRETLDLRDQASTRAFLLREKPDLVLLAAARVGGILANATLPADFIGDNLAIQQNVLQAAWDAGVQRLLFLGSSCIYPRDAPQPLREEYLLSGPLEPTNRPYAVAKIAGIEMCWAWNRQHRTSYLAVMPTNLYGPGDNYDLQGSHVLPALIRRLHEAARRGDAELTLWGSGEPRREFLHSDDLAAACLHVLALPDAALRPLLDSVVEAPLVNIGCGEDLSIRELAQQIAGIVGFSGTLRWDRSMPDGTPRKLLDVSRLRALGWTPSISLDDGLRRTYLEFLEKA